MLADRVVTHLKVTLMACRFIGVVAPVRCCGETYLQYELDR